MRRLFFQRIDRRITRFVAQLLELVLKGHDLACLAIGQASQLGDHAVELLDMSLEMQKLNFEFRYPLGVAGCHE